MSSVYEAIKSVISLNGGTIKGKTRLQKTFFFLENKGASLNLDFDYHHYGPYSETLSATLDFSHGDGVKIQERSTGSTMPSYDISLEDGNFEPKPVGCLSIAEVKSILNTLADFSSWELELAATVFYFKNSGMNLEESLEETKQRKTAKASTERLRKAQELLEKLGLL
jgi:uncharacterized protein YwgA